MISYVWFYYQHALLFQIPPQIWRLATTWLLSGGNISIILDPYFVYMYLSQMETSSPRFTKKEDVVWYLMFVGTLIIVSNALIRVSHGAGCCILSLLFPSILSVSKICTPQNICPDSARSYCYHGSWN